MKIMILTEKVYEMLVSEGYTHLAYADTGPENEIFDSMNNIVTLEPVIGDENKNPAFDIRSEQVKHLMRNNAVRCYVMIKKNRQVILSDVFEVFRSRI